MRFGSVCSGIEAASVAWQPLGWKAAWLSEIEPFPSAVLKHHYPDVPNLGDMTTLPDRILSGEVEAPDLFCGGTPCQAFSVAGLRKSLDDARGNLSLTFCEIANAIDHVRSAQGEQPVIIFWENVPGVLSTQDNAFGCFLAGLAGEAAPLVAPRGKWSNSGVVLGPQRAVAWRVLDAQYFGLAQRRKRVFVVASSREGFDPASVLLEWDGVRRDTAPSREAGKAVAPTIRSGAPNSSASHGQWSGDSRDELIVPVQYGSPISPALKARDYKGPSSDGDGDGAPLITHSMRGEGFDASEDGTGRGTPLVPVAVGVDHYNGALTGTVAATLSTGGATTTGSGPSVMVPVAMRSDVTPKWQDDLAFTLTQPSPTGGGQPQAVFEPYTLAIRGRGDSHNLEYRQDGTANALLTPNGGRGGIGVGAIAHAFDARQSDVIQYGDKTGPLDTDGHSVAVAVRTANTSANGHGISAELAHTLDQAQGQAVAFTTKLHNTTNNQAGKIYEEYTTSLDRSSPPPALLTPMQVRRLTPVECERLQGFPDGYTAIPWRNKPASECPDGPRYKALGNSWAVPVVRWIGKRMDVALKSGCIAS